MRFITAAVLAFMMLLGACGGSTLRPGRTISSELPVPAGSLEERWAGAVDMLLQAGYPVDGTWYAEEYRIPAGGPILIKVSSEDFAPLLALTAADGHVLAAGAGREWMADAILAVREVPEGARLFVFSLDDRRGSYSLESVTLQAGDIEDVEFYPDLDDGRLRGWLPRHREYMKMAEVLEESFEGMVYCENLQTARIHPFSVEVGTLASLDVPEADFDPIMVLLGLRDGMYRYITYNDDTEGLLPRISALLDPGEYAAVLLGYSEGDGGAYVLTLEKTDMDQITVDRIPVVQGEYASARLMTNRNLAIMFWEDMQEEGAWETGLTPSTPTLPFLFTVTDPDVYVLTAESDIDVCLTLLSETGEGLDFLDYNDDAYSADMGSNSRIERMLPPGGYVALVSGYYGGDEGDVTFGFESAGTVFPELQAGRTTEAALSLDQPSVYFRFDIDPATVYTITAEDDELDPTIEVFLPDGQILYDDDGGGDLNSLLTIYPSETQGGTCILKISSYWSENEGTISVRLERSSLI